MRRSLQEYLYIELTANVTTDALYDHIPNGTQGFSLVFRIAFSLYPSDHLLELGSIGTCIGLLSVPAELIVVRVTRGTIVGKFLETHKT